MLNKKTALNERNAKILKRLVELPENTFCADCGSKGPRWASWNIGVFLCMNCAGIHRNLGVHISKVKSTTLDSWTEEQVDSIARRGNKVANAYYEAKLGPHLKRPVANTHEMTSFIRSKYVDKEFTLLDQQMVLSDGLAAAHHQHHHQTHHHSASQKPAPASMTLLAAPNTAAEDDVDEFADFQSAPPTPGLAGHPVEASLDTLFQPSSSLSPPNPSHTTTIHNQPPQRSVKDDIMALFNTAPANPMINNATYTGQFYMPPQQQQVMTTMQGYHNQQNIPTFTNLPAQNVLNYSYTGNTALGAAGQKRPPEDMSAPATKQQPDAFAGLVSFGQSSAVSQKPALSTTGPNGHQQTSGASGSSSANGNLNDLLNFL